MNTNQQLERYFLRLLINGIPDFLVYEVALEDAERLQSVLNLPEDELFDIPFFRFASKEGLGIALSVLDIQMVNFLWEPDPRYRYGDEVSEEEPSQTVNFPWEPDPRRRYEDEEVSEGEPIKIYFRGRPQPFQTYAAHPQEVVRIFAELDTIDLVDESFLSFDDEDGETVSFHPKHVVLMTAPHWLLEDEDEDEELVE